MTLQTPKLDPRSAEDIVKLVKKQEGINEALNGQLGEALVRIFARYCEIIIERLNQVPEKNYRVFLNELGVSRNSPIAAQVPLTFTPVKNSSNTPIVIPQYTKVAAALSEGESSPAVFETNQALTLTKAELVKMVAMDTPNDRYSDISLLTSLDQETAEIFPFKGTRPIRREFYIDIGNSFAANKITSLQLFFSIAQQISASLERRLEWRIESDSETEGQLITAEKDNTMGLSRNGEIIFNNLPEWEISKRGGRKGYWLSCRLLFSGKSTDNKAREMAMLNLPTIDKIEITGYANLEDAKVDSAFCNNMPLDLSKDFFPLSEKPHFGDVVYFNCSVFTKSDVDVVLNIKLTNPASGKKEPPIRRVSQSGRAVIQWEYWNGKHWDILDYRDDTQALTEDGRIFFEVPQTSQETQVNGLQGHWIRAHLISGHYGLQESIEYNNQETLGQGIRYTASTLAPPAIASISVNSSKTVGPTEPVAIIGHNDFVFTHVDLAGGGTFTPFQISHEPKKALYFIFKATDRNMLAGSWLDLYFRVNHSSDKIVYGGDRQFPTLNWQCWNGKIWETCKVRDETYSLNITGVVSLFISEDIDCWKETETSLVKVASSVSQSIIVGTVPREASEERNKTLFFGVRVLWVAGEYKCEPVLQQVLLNTTLARQALTLENEILGSGNGTPNQIFYATRTPILDKLTLEVREPRLPTEAELIRISKEEGEDAVENIKNGQNKEAIWVRWQEVNDFLESGHGDRHFVVERLSGEICFGDGAKGMLPPIGANNIRLRAYKAGGGISGNKPVNSITQLRTSLPLVASVVNHEPAAGGQDIEDWSSVYLRGSSYLRHRGRAITAADYEDLARNASPLVARVKCFPLRDLASDCASTDRPGVVSLVVVPKKLETEPKPSLDLLRRIWEFINPLREQSTSLIVLGPEYIRISVQAVIVPAYEYTEANIVTNCLTQLETFLHPLTGGEHSKGWAFGERPHESDLFALLESIPGLEFVRSIQIICQEKRPNLLENGNFLVCSGKHRITLG